ncbi:MAG: hypothetical protein ACYDEP_08920 [Acidimicrobiales bacterium]|jgi:predicted phage tail protein
MSTVSQMVDGQDLPTPTKIAKVLGYVPRALSSKPHIVFLGALGIYLVVLPLAGIHVSAFSELVGGNYTNVTSDLGACIAAGGTVHLISKNREHRREIEKLHELIGEIHEKVTAE